MKTINRAALATITVTSITVAIFALAMMILSAALAHAQSGQQRTPDPATAPPTAIEANVNAHRESYGVEVDGSKQWTDTAIDLRAGEKLQITAEGTITFADGTQFGPSGIERTIKDVIHAYGVPNGAHGELIGRLGSGNAAAVFEVGTGLVYTAPVAGRLFLGVNQSARDAAGASGLFQVKIEILDEGLKTPEAAGFDPAAGYGSESHAGRFGEYPDRRHRR
jgi:hypothetical protein